MNINTLMTFLLQNNIRLVVNGDKLKIDADMRLFSKEMIDCLKQNKAFLIDWVKRAELGVQTDKHFTPSDFTNARVTQSQLDALLESHPLLQRLYISTPLQTGMLYHAMLDGTGESYTTQISFNIMAGYDHEIFKKAWSFIVQRYDIFRTCFVGFEEKQIHQLVQREVDLPFIELDWSALDKTQQEQQLQQYHLKDKAQGFDFNQPPLMRITLIKLADNEMHCMWTHHHSVLDGWSFPIVFGELLNTYEAFCNAKGPVLPAVIPYENYIGWLNAQSREKADVFWQQHLKGIESPTPLVVDNLTTDPSKSGFQEMHWRMDADISEQLDLLAKDAKVTMNTLTQAAWSVLLHTYSGETSVVFGTTVSGRPSDLPGVEQMVGLFINGVPARVDINPDDTVATLLKTLNDANFARGEYDFLSLSDIQRVTDVPSGTSMFETLVTFENYPDGDFTPSQDIRKGELSLSAFGSDERNNFAVSLAAAVQSNILMLRLGYQADTFSEQTIDRLLGHVVELLTQLAAGGLTQKVGQLNLVTQQEQLQLREQFNDTQADYQADAAIHHLFEQQAKSQPDSIAIEYDGQTLTYGALNEQANQLAHFLLAQGVKPDTLVGLCLDRSCDMVVGMLGILKAGGAYVPIDPDYPEERIDYLLEDSGVTLVLTHSEIMAEMDLDDLTVMPLDAKMRSRLLANYSTDNPDSAKLALASSHLAYVIYTSGSTGQPKGVMVSHQNTVSFVSNTGYISITDTDVMAQAANIAFDAATFEIWGALCNGAKLVYIDKDILLEPEQLVQTLKEKSVTVMFVTTALLNQVAYAQVDCFAALNTLVFGGEQVNYDAVQQIIDNGKPQKLLHIYGPTETTTFTTAIELSGKYSDGERRISIGRPLQNVQTYVFDSQQKLTPIGVVGELCVGGSGVARGYHNQPSLSDEKFVSHPFIAGQRLYKTGDLVRWLPEGGLEFVGRVDHQVKVRGFRIELGEIEHQLRCYDDVKDALVIASADDSKQAHKQLIAYVVPQDEFLQQDDSVLISTYRSHLQGHLPDHMVPSIFIVMDQMPLTANGKVDRKALPRFDGVDTSQSDYVAPRNDIEAKLCDIWQQVLDVKQVGVDDNFFAIGGDSILSIRIVSLAKTMGLALGVKDIFKYHSVALLAEQLSKDTLQTNEAVEIAPFSQLSAQERESLDDDYLQRYDDIYPMSELQRGMLFHTEMAKRGDTYHDVFSFHTKSVWQQSCFEQALAFMFKQHPVLRTGYQLEGERPLQFVNKQIALPLVCEDISQLSEPDQQTFMADWVEREKSVPFEWQGPLFKTFVFLRTKESFEFAISFHHAVYDGWSNSIFISQLFIHYQRLLSAQPLPALRVDTAFRDFVAFEHEVLGNEEARLFWAELLADAPTQQITRNPVKTVDVTGSTESKATKNHVTEAFTALSVPLIEFAKKQGVPIQSVFLAVHSKVMVALSGQKQALSSVVTNGRPEREGGELGLGLFLNSLPVNIDVKAQSWAQLIESVVQRYNQCMAYRHYPSSAIQRETGRSFSEVLFNYTHFHAFEDMANESDAEFIDTQGFEQTNFDFCVNFSRAPGLEHLSLAFTYDEALYDDALVERIGDYYMQAFTAMLADPNQSHNQHSLLGNEEQQLLMQFNDTAMDYPQDKGIHQLFEAQAQRVPQQTAVVFGEQSLSYQALNQQANQLAHYLLAQGVKPQSMIGLCIERSPQMMVALLAILKTGCCYVPIDAQYPQQRIEHMVQDGDIQFLLTQQALLESLHFVTGVIVALDDPAISAQLTEKPVTDISNDAINDCSSALAYVLYTSGSTGAPKGVMATHQNVIRLVYGCDRYIGIDGPITSLLNAPVSFDAATFEIWLPLLTGGTGVGYDQSSIDVDRLNQIVDTNQVNLAWLTAGLFDVWVDSEGAASSPLQTIVTGGDVVAAQSVKKLYDKHDSIRVVNGYGPTECVTFSCSYVVPRTFDSAQPLPIGKPVADTQVYVLSAEQALLPVGAVGEVYIGGAGVAKGYLNQQALSAEQFIADPFSDKTDARLYKTGDLARWSSQGELQFVGRIDHQVKVRGFRIELGEIEHQLAVCQGVKESVVISVDDSKGDKRLVAYIVAQQLTTELASEEQQSTEQEGALIDDCRAKLLTALPDHMMPAVIMVLDEMPLTANGKVDRKMLPAPDGSEMSAIEYVAPRSDTEQQLCQIWQEILDIDKIGINDNFFILGGHSLLVTRLISLIRQSFEVEMDIAGVFENPTIGAFAELLDSTISFVALAQLNQDMEEQDESEEVILL